MAKQERIERAVPRDDGVEKRGGYPAGPKPADGYRPCLKDCANRASSRSGGKAGVPARAIGAG